MADYENSEEIEASCEDQDLLQADLNLRTTRWTNTSATVLNEEPNEVQEEICDSVVEEIVVEQANENYISCIDDDCIEDSIVYVFEEPVVEFELSDSAYVIQEPEEAEMNSEEIETSQFENEDESVIKCCENDLNVNKCTVGSDNLKTYNRLDNNLEISYNLSNEMEEDTSVQGELSDAEDSSASNVLIGPLLPNQIPDYIPDNDENTSEQSPNVSGPPDTPDLTPLSALNKNNLTPLRKVVLLNESSPLETKSPSSESSISPALKTLGKDQIKKRLQSFSLMKQGIQPIPIKKILNPKQPKVHTTIEEVYDEIGRKTEEKQILKKPPKQGPTPSEKARQVINEIEQIKREEQEIYEQTLLYMKHSMRDAHSRRSKFYRGRDRSRSRSKSPIRRDRKYDKETPKRPRKISEDDKFRRSLENDKRITENDPRMTENDRRISESDRQISESDRRISESDRRISESDRRISESDRRKSPEIARRKSPEIARRKSPEIARRKILEIPKLEKKKIEKPEPPKEEEMPRSWTEIKKKNIDFAKIKRIKERIFKFNEQPITVPIWNKQVPIGNKKGNKKKNQQQQQQIQPAIRKEDVLKPQLIFETPSLLRTLYTAQSTSGHPKYYPPEVIRFTEKLPEISYSENPNSSNDFFRNRKRVLSEIPEERAEIMMKIIENKLEPVKPGKYVEGVWYSKDYLEEEPQNPIESVTSYGLSVLSEMYDDEQEEIQEPVETAKDETEKEETEKDDTEKEESEKEETEKDETEKDETKTKNKKEKKKSKKKRKHKSKSRSSSEERTHKQKKQKKKKKRSKKKKNKKEKSPSPEETEEIAKPEQVAEKKEIEPEKIAKPEQEAEKKEEEKEDGTPNTEEYRSNWESDEEFLNDIIPGDRSFGRKNLGKNWEIEEPTKDKFEERQFVGKEQRKPRRSFPEDRRKDKYMDYQEISPVPEEKISSKRSNNREIDDFEYHSSNIRLDERSFSRQSYEKRESKFDYDEKSSRRPDRDEFRRSSSSLTKSEERIHHSESKKSEPDRHRKSLDRKHEERKDKYMDFDEISLPSPEERMSSKRSNNRELDDFEYHSSNIRLDERSFSRQSYEKRESKYEYEEKSSRRSDEFRRSSSSLTKSEERTRHHSESDKRSEPDRHRKSLERKHEEDRRHHSVEKKKSIDYKEDKSKIEPENRKYEQEHRNYEPENRKYDQEIRKYEPENRKYEQQNRKYELENRNYEPETRKYEQDTRKYEQENRKYEQENRKYEQENRKYEPENRKYEQQNRKYEPENRNYQPENRKYEQEHRKYEQENRKYEPENIKYEQENRNYEQENLKYVKEIRKYDMQNKIYEPEDRKYEQENRKYEQENRKYEKESRKYDLENKKCEPEDRKYEQESKKCGPEDRKYEQENRKYEQENRKCEQENRKCELDNRKCEPDNRKSQEHENKKPKIEAGAKSYSKEKPKLKEDIKKPDVKSRHSIESDVKPLELERKPSKDRKHETKDNKREEKKAPYHKWSSDEDLHKSYKQDKRKSEEKHTQNIELNLNYKKYQKSQWSSDEEFVRAKDKYDIAPQFDRRINYVEGRRKSRWHNEEPDIYNKYDKIVSLLDVNLVNLKDLERNRKLAEENRHKSEEKPRKSDERDRKKEKYDKKDDKHKKNKKKSREKKDKSKKPKVKINYSEDEESYDEDFKTAKQKSLAVENAKKYAAKIKIDYSDFDISLSECKDKYDKKFDDSRNPSPDKNIETPLTPKERKINIDLSEIIKDQPVTKNDVDFDTISSPETPKTSNSEIVISDASEIVEIKDSPTLETPISAKITAKITEEFNTPKNKKTEVAGITPIIQKENTTPLLATPVPSIENISPVAPPVLPIPKPVVDLPITPVIQDASKLVSEYEEFMKAVSFDEPKEEEVIQEKQQDIPEIADKQPEIPGEIEEQAEKKDSESSVEESSSEYDSSEPSDTSSESDSSDSEMQRDKILEMVANIKTEKITDSEESQDSKTDKRKRDDSVEKEIITNVVVKIEKDAKKQKVEEIQAFECETKYDNVIDWEKSYTNKVETNKSIVDICDIMPPSILPENIPLPNENTVETIAVPEIPPQDYSAHLQSPKEVVTISSDSSTPSPVKKSRSFIPIKLLTAESRKQANETAQFIPSDQDQSPGFGKFAPKDILSQDVESCADLNQTDIINEQGDTLENSRKRQSQWNLNITPAKKPLLQPSALAEDDSDEDFTDKFIKPDKKIEQDKKEGPTKEKLEIASKELEKIEPAVLDKKDDKKPELKKSKEEEDKRKIDKPKEKHHSPDRHKDDHKPRRSPPRNLQETRPPRRPSPTRDRYDRPRPHSPERKRDRSRDRGLRDPRDIRDPRERERELREREKRRLSDRRPPDRKSATPRGRSPRARYSREREMQRARPRERSRERPRPPERERERSRERIRERSRDRDHREKIERRDYRNERRFSRSPSPHRKENIPHPRLDDTDFSTTSMDIVQSPVNSPLDGFKRSLADSTISDSELITQLNTPDESNEPSPTYTRPPPQQYFPPQVREIPPETRRSPSSPKRISLDDRINLVLGIEKEPPKPIDTVCTRGPFSNPPPNYDPYGYNRSEYDVYTNQPPPDRYAPPPYNQYQYQNYPPPSHNTDNNVKVVQVGNVIQVVPTEQPPPIIQPPITQPPIVRPPMQKPEQPKVVQVGNMLQIVPVTIMETKAAIPASPVATVAQIEEKPTIVSPPKMTEQIAAERRAEKEKRRQEREARRKEKERKRKEKEKRRQLKIKTKMDNMVKKALELETGEGDLDISNTEEATPETNDNNNFPVAWPPASSLTTPSLPKPPGKGILVTHGFREKDESLDDSTEIRKVVKFADGICPGEGTSPSAGEDLPSPPPPPRKLPKEKRYKKSKNKNKKKIKVKIIRTQQQTPDDDSSSEDNLPPPPPPPGSPPPHLWPPRIKQPPVNNIHPQVLSFPTPPPPQVLYPPAFPPMRPMTHAPPPPPPRQHHPPVMPVLQTGPPPPPSHHGAHQTSFHH